MTYGLFTRAAWNDFTAETMLKTAALLVDRRLLVSAICRCVRLVLLHFPEDLCQRAVEVAEAWVRGETADEDVLVTHRLINAHILDILISEGGDSALYAAHRAAAVSVYSPSLHSLNIVQGVTPLADWAKRVGVPETDLQDAVRDLWHDVDDAQLRKLAAEDPEALAAHLYGEQGRGGRLETRDVDERGRLEALSIELEWRMGVRTEAGS